MRPCCAVGPGSGRRRSSRRGGENAVPDLRSDSEWPEGRLSRHEPAVHRRFRQLSEQPAEGESGRARHRQYRQHPGHRVFPATHPAGPEPHLAGGQQGAQRRHEHEHHPGADYRTKFATTMSSDDLPDIMHIFFGYTVAPNLPDFFRAKCADLTPYLAGDAAKDYPNLAAIPTPAWKNSISAVNGALYLVPIHRQMTSIPPYGGNFFKNIDQWDADLGQDFVPKNADDFKRALQQVTRPQQNQWGIGSFGTNNTLFGIGSFLQMFNAPNDWKIDSSGKLIKDYETEEYKAAVGYMRDLFAAGMYWPDSVQATMSRNDFVCKKVAVSPDGKGNSWVDFWQRGLPQQPPTRFGLIKPFSAVDGQKPITFLGTGFVSMNVLKKASPDRIKEL